MSSNTSENNTPRNKRKQQQQQPQRVQTISKAESMISSQVFYNRRNEIHEYLKLFGYKADKTIIQVHVTGDQKEKAHQAAAIKRCGGISFIYLFPDASNSSYTNQNEQHADPVTIVKRRLAQGEINCEEQYNPNVDSQYSRELNI